jgi:hypothetical protein
MSDWLTFNGTVSRGAHRFNAFHKSGLKARLSAGPSMANYSFETAWEQPAPNSQKIQGTCESLLLNRSIETQVCENVRSQHKREETR